MFSNEAYAKAYSINSTADHLITITLGRWVREDCEGCTGGLQPPYSCGSRSI